jgi:hypothetical protein
LGVIATASGSIGSDSTGLSYENSSLYESLFTPSNIDLLDLFKRLGARVLRFGGNSVDHSVWTPN